MNRGLVFAAALAALLAVALCAPKGDVEVYTTKYDSINVEEILSNPRLYRNYMNCLMGDSDARCTPEGRELRRVLPDALETRCAKCSEIQKSKVKKVINVLRKEHADDWEKLRAKWDPDNVFYQKYDDLLKN